MVLTLKWVGEGKEERVDTDDLRMVMVKWLNGGLYNGDGNCGLSRWWIV